MALSGTFTFKKHETIDCSISVDNVATLGSQKLILKITIPATAGILTTTAVGTHVGVHNKDAGIFHVVGTASEINQVLSTLRFQHLNDNSAVYAANVDLRPYDAQYLNTGEPAIFGSFQFVPYQWPAVTWTSEPKAVFSTPASAETLVIKLPSVSDTGVGLLQAKIEPLDSPLLGSFHTPEASRDKGQGDSSAMVFSGSRTAVNAWLASAVWKKGTITSEANYKVTVTDGRTNTPAIHTFKVILSPEITAPSTLTLPNTTGVALGAALLGAAVGTMTVSFAVVPNNAGTFSLTQGTFGTVTPTIVGNRVIITGTNATDINAAMAGVRLSAVAGYPNAYVQVGLNSTSLGELIGKSILYRYQSPTLGGTKALVITEDTPKAFGSGLTVASSINMQSMVCQMTVSPVGAATLSGTGGAWDAVNGILNYGSTSSVTLQTAITNTTITPAANRYTPFTITVATSDSYGPTNQITVGATMTAVDDPVFAANLTTARVWFEDEPYLFNPPIILGTVDESEPSTVTLVGDANFTGTLSSIGGGVWTPGTKTWEVAGSLEYVNAVLAGLTYTPPVGFKTNFTISATVRDAANGGPATATIGMTCLPFADFRTAYNYTEDSATDYINGPAYFGPGKTLSPVNKVNMSSSQTATVVMTIPVEAGTLRYFGYSEVPLPIGTNSITFTGTSAEINAYLAELHYLPTPDYYQNFTLTWSVSRTGKTANGTISFTGTDVADALKISKKANTFDHRVHYQSIDFDFVSVDGPVRTANSVHEVEFWVRKSNNTSIYPRIDVVNNTQQGIDVKSAVYTGMSFGDVPSQVPYGPYQINGTTVGDGYYYYYLKVSGASIATLEAMICNFSTGENYQFEPWNWSFNQTAMTYVEDTTTTIGNRIVINDFPRSKMSGPVTVFTTTKPIGGDFNMVKSAKHTITANTPANDVFTVDVAYRKDLGITWTFGAGFSDYTPTVWNPFNGSGNSGYGYLINDTYNDPTGVKAGPSTYKYVNGNAANVAFDTTKWGVKRISGTMAQVNAAIAAITFKNAKDKYSDIHLYVRGLIQSPTNPSVLINEGPSGEGYSALYMPPFQIVGVRDNKDFFTDFLGGSYTMNGGSFFPNAVGIIGNDLDDQEDKTWAVSLVDPTRGVLRYNPVGSTNLTLGGTSSFTETNNTRKSLTFKFEYPGGATDPAYTITGTDFAFDYVIPPVTEGNSYYAYYLPAWPSTFAWPVYNYDSSNILIDISISDGLITKSGRYTVTPTIPDTSQATVTLSWNSAGGHPKLRTIGASGVQVTVNDSSTVLTGSKTGILSALNGLYMDLTDDDFFGTATFTVTSPQFRTLTFTATVNNTPEYTGHTDPVTGIPVIPAVDGKMSFPIRVTDNSAGDTGYYRAYLWSQPSFGKPVATGTFDTQTDCSTDTYLYAAQNSSGNPWGDGPRWMVQGKSKTDINATIAACRFTPVAGYTGTFFANGSTQKGHMVNWFIQKYKNGVWVEIGNGFMYVKHD